MVESIACRRLQSIIQNRQLTPLFQPIVCLRQGSIVAQEALIRGPQNDPMHSPLVLFEHAAQCGQLAALEYACREEACTQFAARQQGGKLFLNVSPMALTEPGYRFGVTLDILERLGLSADQVVIELSERYPLGDFGPLRRATEHYRQMGLQIAIDDLGAGYAGLRVWAELRPDYVKIDRHFVDGIDQDSVKAEFVRSIVNIAKGLHCQVIAEGIERAEELHTLQRLGVAMGQGFFLQRPQSYIRRELSPGVKELCCNRAAQPRCRFRERAESLLISHLPTLAPSCSLEQAGDLFHRHRHWQFLPVVEGTQPVGILRRVDLLEQLSARYYRELHGRKPIADLLDPNAVIVPHDATLDEVSRWVTEEQGETLLPGFLITREGEYLGVGDTRNLLRKITEAQMRAARYANPLTELPGNVPLYERIDEALGSGESMHVAYCDLNHFKPYNDHYGYRRGDEVLLSLARLLQEMCEGRDDFIGHIGGDDFLLVLIGDDWQIRCEQLIDRFNERVLDFYEPEDRAAGGVWGVDRQGQRAFFPLLALAIGVVHPDPAQCHSHHEVASLASAAKKQAKCCQGGSLYISPMRGVARLEAISGSRSVG